MLIQELERKSGLTRATIRYYEKEGFLSPARLENGYRVYSQEDLEQLMKIHLLRELGMSLDTIRQIRKDESDFHKALADQMQVLDGLSRTADRAKEVCNLLYKDNATYSGLNAVFYLQELNKTPLPEPAEKEEIVVQPHTEKVYYRQYHPVRRFLARTMDYQICHILIRFILIVVCKIRPIESIINSLIAFAIPFLMIPIESIMLSKWGTTPGKWLYGLSVWDKNGYTLSYAEAKERTWRVLKDGYGFGIPVYRLYRMYKSYMQYGDVELEWDINTDYQYHLWDKRRKLSLVAVVILLIGLSTTSVLSVFNPVHRGEVTVAEFADNYNFYVDALQQGSGVHSTLKADGTYYDYDSNIIYTVPNTSKNPDNRDFIYTTEEGNITSIAYQREYTDVFLLRAQSEQCVLAAVTMVMSQRGNHVIDLLSVLRELDIADFTKSGSVIYENIEIRWAVETHNSTTASGGFFVTKDKSQPSWVKIAYQISVLDS